MIPFFPPEITVEILKYYDIFSRFYLREVSLYLCNLVDFSWKNSKIPHVPSFILDPVLYYFRECKELNLKLASKITNEGLKYLKDVETLTLDTCYGGITDEGLKYLSNVKNLIIRGDLVVYGGIMKKSTITNKGMKDLSNLKSFSTEGNFPKTSLKGIKYIIKASPELTKLTISHYIISSKWLKWVGENAHKLRKLDISECRFEYNFSHGLEFLHDLEEIGVGPYQELELKDFIECNNGKLRTLFLQNLYIAHTVDDNYLKCLSLSSLRKLKLSNFPEITIDSIKWFLEGNKNLSVLKILYCSNITRDLPRKLQQYSQLRKITMKWWEELEKTEDKWFSMRSWKETYFFPLDNNLPFQEEMAVNIKK